MLENAEPQAIFDINDTSPLELIQIDKSDGEEIIRVIPKEYSLYFILKLFRSLMLNPEQQKTLSLEIIDQVYDLTLEKLKRKDGKKWVLPKIDSSFWIKDFILINGYLSHLIAKGSSIGEALLELVIRTGFALEKNVQFKYGKNGFENFIGPIVSDALVTLATLYFKGNQFHLSEAYCLKHLDYLETLSSTDVKDLNKRKFLAKILLAHIYLKSGNSHVAVHFFKMPYQTLERYYNAEFNYVLPYLWELYKDTLCHFYDKNKDLLKVLDVYQSFLKDHTQVNTTSARYSEIERKKHSLKAETLAKMQRDIKFIHLIFQGVQPKYKSDFKERLENSSLLKDKVNQFTFDFDKNILILAFEDSALNPFLKNAFKARCTERVSHLDNQFSVPIHQCSITQLERVYQYALFLQKENLARQAQRNQEKTSEIVFNPLVNSQSETVSETSIFSAPVISQPEKISYTRTVQSKAKKKKQPAEHITPRSSLSTTEVSRIRYQWPSGLAYDSAENNQGQVKMLTNDFLPDGIWFGYIPDSLKTNEHYIEEFSRKLIRGFIGQDCIREITKQLRTWKNQNFSTEHPYKFKIVVKNYDYRIYGWIEEVLIDEEGKSHFLICFGFLGSHKLRYLPDPEKVKKYSLNTEKTVPEEEQAYQNNMIEQFIEKLTGVIYDDRFVIPVEMQNVLQGLINSLYNSAKIFGEKGLTLEQAKILFAALEKMCDQIVEFGQMELGSKEQLGILKDMIDLLSVLNEQEIYQRLISPLVKVVEYVENYYCVDELQPGEPLQEVISEESSDDIQIAELIKRMSEGSGEITEDMNKFKKAVVDQQQVKKTQIASTTQKPSLPGKDVTEIISPRAGEPKLKF